MNKAQIEYLKEIYPAGTRVRLKTMAGEEQMPQGLYGTVFHIDDIGQIHVEWDNGSTLALEPGVDQFSKIELEQTPEMEQNM